MTKGISSKAVFWTMKGNKGQPRLEANGEALAFFDETLKRIQLTPKEDTNHFARHLEKSKATRISRWILGESSNKELKKGMVWKLNEPKGYNDEMNKFASSVLDDERRQGSAST